jgi:putative transposase
MRARYPRHLAAFDYIGQHQYSLTFCTFDRHLAFTTDHPVAEAWSQILRASHEQYVEVLAYCFMPDHLHLVAEGTRDDADGLEFIRKAKQYSGYYHKQRFARRLWQKYGYEHVIRDDERLDRIIRYVLENPVRAGLVQRVEDYPYWGSAVWTRGQLLGISLAWGSRGAEAGGPADAGRHRGHGSG